MGVTPPTPAAEPQAETFTASRWTQGNFLFPTRIVVSPLRVSRVKSRWFGSNDESIRHVEGCLGPYLYRSAVGGDSD